MVHPTWLVRGGAAGTVARLGRVETLAGMDDEQLLERAADADRLVGWAVEQQARFVRELDARRERTERSSPSSCTLIEAARYFPHCPPEAAHTRCSTFTAS